MRPLRWLVIAADVLFVLCIGYNGASEGFKGTSVEVASYVGLVVLLVLSALLLVLHRRLWARLPQ